MRISFDLIAAIICLEAIAHDPAQAEFARNEHVATAPDALALWGAYLLIIWLLGELVTRDTEWRTRFGLHPTGIVNGGSASIQAGGFRALLGKIRFAHPITIHAWGILAVQAFSVVGYVAILRHLHWPLWVSQWPFWFGLNADTHIGALKLSESLVVNGLLCIAPFMLAMVVSWIPRRRLYSGIRNRHVPILKFVFLEAKLSWLPLIIGVVMSFLQDGIRILPDSNRASLEDSGWAIWGSLVVMLLMAFVALPKLVIWLWRCGPLPEGELKTRLTALMARSGVKANSILLWGTQGSGMLNACIMGPWARYRYVLISPQLVDELSMEETEAVLAHELGHARHGHLTLFVVMLFCLSVTIDPLSRLLPGTWQNSPIIVAAFTIAFVISYVWGFLGSVMRQCEREADLASAELLGTPEPLITALEKLARITGNIRNVWCWHHGSIAERVSSVQRLSADPKGSKHLHDKIRRIRILLALFAVVGLGTELAFEYSEEPPRAEHPSKISN